MANIIENNDASKIYKFVEDVCIGKIQKSDEFWYYRLSTTVHPSTTYEIVYHSTNLLSLKRHRENTIAKYEAKNQEHMKSSYTFGVNITPTIFERLKASKNEKIR